MNLSDRLADETTLSPQQARVVALRVEEGLSWQQVADEMGLAVGTVRRYYDRAEEKAQTAKTSVEVFEEIGLL